MASSLPLSALLALWAPAPAPSEPPPPSAVAPDLAPAPAPDAEPDDAADATAVDESPAPEDAPAPASGAPPGPTSPSATPVAPVPVPPAPAPPPPPRPIRWRLDLGVGAGTTVVGDPGLRAFTSGRNLPETGASAIFDFRLAGGRFFVGGGLAYQHVGRHGDALGSQLLTALELHEPQVVGRGSASLVEGLDAFARVGVGPSIARLGMQSSGYEPASLRHVLPKVDARAGLSLYLPKAWLPRKQAARVTGGLELGVGYAWRGGLEVRPTLVQDDDPLRATTASWGGLALRGVSLGVTLFVRVM